MADQAYTGTCLAVGVQTALGTVHSTVDGLSTSISSSDGVVLGVLDAGDAESGITIPTLSRVGFDKARLANFTRQPTDYLRVGVTDLSIAIPFKGNGADATPSAGEAQPLAGIDALWRGAGLVGANDTSPTYSYTPASTVEYLTAKLWLGDQSFTFMDCLCNAEIVLTPGGIGVVTFSFEVGSLYAQADGVTFPTVSYTTQTDLSSPIVQQPTSGNAHEWPSGTSKGFNAYSLSISNNLERYPDSNQATGERVDVSGRDIDLNLITWIVAADTDFEYEELIRTSITSSAEVVQIGDATTTGILNAYKIELLNPEVSSLKYNRIGTNLVVESTLRAVDNAAGGEFKLTFN